MSWCVWGTGPALVTYKEGRYIHRIIQLVAFLHFCMYLHSLIYLILLHSIMTKRNTDGKKIKCNHCGYIWYTHSEKIMTSCPQCTYRVRISKSITTEDFIDIKPKINKRNIYALIYNRKKTGKIKKPECCQHCNKKTADLETHHNDYSDPLKVIWLCKTCHKKYDKHVSKKMYLNNINFNSTSIKLNSYNIFDILYFKALYVQQE